jgi:hypothetical protein
MRCTILRRTDAGRPIGDAALWLVFLKVLFGLGLDGVELEILQAIHRSRGAT